jgi:hypothetical protein
MDALADSYVAVFATVLLGSMVVSVIVNLRLVSNETCVGDRQQARTLMPWLVPMTALAVVLVLARLFGPGVRLAGRSLVAAERASGPRRRTPPPAALEGPPRCASRMSGCGGGHHARRFLTATTAGLLPGDGGARGR